MIAIYRSLQAEIYFSRLQRSCMCKGVSWYFDTLTVSSNCFQLLSPFSFPLRWDIVQAPMFCRAAAETLGRFFQVCMICCTWRNSAASQPGGNRSGDSCTGTWVGNCPKHTCPKPPSSTPPNNKGIITKVIHKRRTRENKATRFRARGVQRTS